MAIKTQFKNFGKKKEGGSGSGGGNVYAGGSTQIFGNTNTYDLTATNGIIYNLKGDKLDYNNGNFDNLVATNGNITNLTGYTLNFNTADIDNIMSDIIHANNVGTEDDPIDEIYAHKANIDQILSTNITTDYLTVTKSAHFFELIIDKIKSVGGSIILSATNCTLDYVEPTTITVDNVTYDAYEVWWKAKGPDGRETSNDWWKYDQAICQSFNNVTEGVNNNVDSKYYWRLVMDVRENNTPRPNPYYMWLGDENDPRNGTRIMSQYEINYNSLNIYDVTAIMQTNFVGSSYTWNVTAHGGSWSSSNVTGHPSRGTYYTTSTTDYLELTPGWNQDVSGDTGAIVPNILRIELGRQTPCCFADWARLNVFVEYADGTSFCQPAKSVSYLPDSDVSVGTTCSPHPIMISLNTTTEIKRVCIFNADPVQWQKVHHITLGNDNRNGQNYTYPQYDENSSYGYSSVPAPGDSLVHLGYRWFAAGDVEHAWRASAIMIAAYKTPDPDLTPPSYAHYKDITSFNLRTKRHTYFDATKAHFVGDFYVDANKTIQMNVFDTINNRTGINIEQGTITLDADNTYVNGNLTLTSNDQGFTVKGEHGTTIMTPESLGTYASFIGSSNISSDIDATSYSITTTSGSNYNTSFTYDYCIGYAPSGSNITISNQSHTYKYGKLDGTLASVSAAAHSVTYQAYLDDGTGRIDTSSSASSSAVVINGTTVTYGTITTNYGGRIWIRATWSPQFAMSNFTNYDGLGIRANLKYTVTYPITGTFTKIASDGIGINMDGSKFVYIGNDGVFIDYPGNPTGISPTYGGGLRINGTGIRKRHPNGLVDVTSGDPLWVTMSTLYCKRLGAGITGYTIDDKDELLVIDDRNSSTTTLTITLPVPIEWATNNSNGWAGRIIWIKNYSNATVKVSCTSGSYGYLYPAHQDSVQAEMTIYKDSRCFVCDGNYWIEYNAKG